MTEGLNRVCLLGNLGADPELRTTAGGQAVLKLRLACSESYVDRDQQRKERTEWVDVAIWGKRGEALAKILQKGDRLYVEGSLRTTSYEKDGEKRYRTEVNGTNVLLCGGQRGETREERREPARAPGRPREQRRQAPHDDPYGYHGGPADDSDIPF